MTQGRTGIVTTRVRFGETDAAGIVFYPTFFAWFDMGTHALVRGAAGDGARDAQGRPRYSLAIVDCGASFSVPLFYDDEIAIRSTIVALGTSSVRIGHIVTRGDVEVARGFEARVLMRHDGDRFTSTPIPDELRSYFIVDDTAPELASPG